MLVLDVDKQQKQLTSFTRIFSLQILQNKVTFNFTKKNPPEHRGDALVGTLFAPGAYRH